MARILVTGVLVLDQIFDLSAFPVEDTKQRALSRTVRPGGNATNIGRVLVQAGHEVELVAPVAQGAEGDRLLQTISSLGIGTRFCPRKPGAVPVSVVLRSAASGSRTIIHFRNLPELDYVDFRSIPIELFDWFHFEGRHPASLRPILQRVRKERVDQPLSVEFERVEPGLAELIGLPDLALFGRSWVEASEPGKAPEAFLQPFMNAEHPPIVALTWGEAGAWLASRGALHFARREVPEIRDSLGAGDCFTAGLIHALISGMPEDGALRHAVDQVTRKLAHEGLDATPVG